MYIICWLFTVNSCIGTDRYISVIYIYKSKTTVFDVWNVIITHKNYGRKCSQLIPKKQISQIRSFPKSLILSYNILYQKSEDVNLN